MPGNLPQDANGSRQDEVAFTLMRLLGPQEVIRFSVFLRFKRDVIEVARNLQNRRCDPQPSKIKINQYVETGAINEVADHLRGEGITVVLGDARFGRIVCEATSEILNRVFAIRDLGRYCQAYGGDDVIFHRGEIVVPQAIEPLVIGIVGFDRRPILRPHLSTLPRADFGFAAREVAAIYGFPADLNGSGVTVGILEFGGGYRQDDLDCYFREAGVASPTVISTDVFPGKNSPQGIAQSADSEVALDLELIGSFAPGATLAIFFCENSQQGFVDGLITALQTTNLSVVSISWGAAENEWQNSTAQIVNHLLIAAALMGISVCAASGDNGALDDSPDGSLQVDFPASSPWAVGCGGTSLYTSPYREICWGDGLRGASGGGFSVLFGQPAYQHKLLTAVALERATRGVPDVAANADIKTGYWIYVDGKRLVSGGTSAAAPLWSAIFALINQRRASKCNGPIGFANAALYQAIYCFNDVTEGSNMISGRGFSAGKGWDACTGLGSPKVADLIELLA